MHTATCSIEFTASDWFTALHNTCSRLIAWLVACFFCLAWLLHSYQIIACFLTAFIMSPRNIHTPKSDQKWPEVARRFKESKLLMGKKSQRNALKTFLSLAGSWISTVHTMLNTLFCFLPDFSVWKYFGMVIFGQLIDKLRENKFWTVLDRFGPGRISCTGGF